MGKTQIWNSTVRFNLASAGKLTWAWAWQSSAPACFSILLQSYHVKIFIKSEQIWKFRLLWSPQDIFFLSPEMYSQIVIKKRWNLIDKNIPSHPILRKIVDKNIVYRCMPNIRQKISNHNFKIKKTEKEKQPTFGCN